MKYLAIDTNADLLVVLKNGSEKHVKRLIGSQMKHSLTLMPYIEEILEETKMQLSDLDFFAVVIGPGSFTGIRIGVATVKALAFATGKKVLAVNSFDLLAYTDNAPEKAFCLVNANHDNYYCSSYLNGKVELAPCFLNVEQVVERSQGYSLCASEENLFENQFTCDAVSGLFNAIENKLDQLTDYNQIEPLYVKRSQAEEELC